MTSKLVYKWLAAAAFGVLPLGSAISQDAQEPVPTQAVVRRVALQDGGTGNFLFVDEAPPQGEYWIGIALGELPPLVRKQLKLASGLVVEDVLPDSPAAKAEFKQYDVLLKAGNKPLAAPADIQSAVEEAKETELSIIAVRDGEQLTLKVTPVKRPPPEATQTQPVEVDAHADLRRTSINKIEEALRELKGKSDHEAIELYFARPAVVTPRYKEVLLPKNMSIRVTKEGDGPANVYIKQDDKEWNVTADKTAELPEDVRRHVEQLLGKVMHPILSKRAQQLVVGDPEKRYTTTVRRGVPGAPGTPAVAPPVYRDPRPVPPNPGSPLHAYRLETRRDTTEDKLNLILKKLDAQDSNALDQLQEEVKRLRKELDELRRK